VVVYNLLKDTQLKAKKRVTHGSLLRPSLSNDGPYVPLDHFILVGAAPPIPAAARLLEHNIVSGWTDQTGDCSTTAYTTNMIAWSGAGHLVGKEVAKRVLPSATDLK
jgi:hypothetical protein